MFVEEVLLKESHIEAGPRGALQRVRWVGDMSDGKGPSPAETAAAKGIFAVLARHYPGHPWSLEVNGEHHFGRYKGGYGKLGIMQLLGPHWGMIVHLDSWTEHQVMDYAGQILERFKIPRSTLDIAYYMSAAAKIPYIGRFRARDAHRIPV